MEITLPKLGEGADSGTVVNLFVKEGDHIRKDQNIVELENEKAVASIPSTGSGVVTKIHVQAGDKLSVGQSILSYDPEETDGAKAKPSEEKAEEDEGKPEEEKSEAK